MNVLPRETASSEDPAALARIDGRITALERSLERGFAAIIEQVVKIRAALSESGGANPTSLECAMERITELEIRLEDALSPPEPLPDKQDRPMTPRQRAIYAVLKRAARVNAQSFVRKDALMSALYGLDDDMPDRRALDVHIFHLRRKLPEGEHIETVRGEGWRLVESMRTRRAAYVARENAGEAMLPRG